MSNTFFITGCASGIGRHLTNALQKRGDLVFATDVNLEGLTQTARELAWPSERVRTARLDVTDPLAWENVFAEAVGAWGHIDVTMNVAGLLLSSWVTESPLSETNGQIDVNLKGVVYGTQVSARHMASQGRGHIINIASIAALVPVPGMSVYAATKAAVRSFSLSTAIELRPKGVYVTAFCPATIQTPMLDNQDGVEAAEMFFSGWRILTLDEIEHAILYRVLPSKPLEVHIPRMKLKMVQVLGIFPRLGPLFAPIYQRSGRRRMAKRQETRR